jgi:hypothetical protein
MRGSFWVSAGVVKTVPRHSSAGSITALNRGSPAKQTMDGRRMPALSPGGWNSALIHDLRHLFECQMLAKLRQYWRELPGKFNRLRPILP